MEKANEEFGYNFRSAFECKVAYKLSAIDVDWYYERDKLDFYAPSRNGSCLDCGSSNTGKRCVYLVDFSIVRAGESTIVLETKGRLTSTDRTKYVNIKNSNPDVDFRFLFQSDNWLSNKTKKTRYSKWATQKGFHYAIGETSTTYISQPIDGLTKS